VETEARNQQEKSNPCRHVALLHNENLSRTENEKRDHGNQNRKTKSDEGKPDLRISRRRSESSCTTSPDLGEEQQRTQEEISTKLHTKPKSRRRTTKNTRGN
jgi:hypothetical protein